MKSILKTLVIFVALYVLACAFYATNEIFKLIIEQLKNTRLESRLTR